MSGLSRCVFCNRITKNRNKYLLCSNCGNTTVYLLAKDKNKAIMRLIKK